MWWRTKKSIRKSSPTVQGHRDRRLRRIRTDGGRGSTYSKVRVPRARVGSVPPVRTGRGRHDDDVWDNGTSRLSICSAHWHVLNCSAPAGVPPATTCWGHLRLSPSVTLRWCVGIVGQLLFEKCPGTLKSQETARIRDVWTLLLSLAMCPKLQFTDTTELQQKNSSKGDILTTAENSWLGRCWRDVSR